MKVAIDYESLISNTISDIEIINYDYSQSSKKLSIRAEALSPHSLCEWTPFDCYSPIRVSPITPSLIVTPRLIVKTEYGKWRIKMKNKYLILEFLFFLYNHGQEIFIARETPQRAISSHLQSCNCLPLSLDVRDLFVHCVLIESRWYSVGNGWQNSGTRINVFTNGSYSAGWGFFLSRKIGKYILYRMVVFY